MLPCHTLTRKVFQAAVLMLAAGLSLFAQSGTMTGTVTDPVGAVLPGALITITNVDNNFERTFTTDDRGDYTVTLLPAGLYRIEVALAGFRTAVVENISVSLDDRLRIDFMLQIG